MARHPSSVLLFILFNIARLACACALWIVQHDIDLTGIIIFYLLSFFFDAVDGPCALFLTPDEQLLTKKAFFYEAINTFCLLSFFFIIGYQTDNIFLIAGGALLFSYSLIGFAYYCCHRKPHFHMACCTLEELYNHWGKKMIRLAPKGSAFLLVLHHVGSSTNDTFVGLYNDWVNMLGSFEHQSLLLLWACLILCYLGLLSPSILSIFDPEASPGPQAPLKTS